MYDGGANVSLIRDEALVEGIMPCREDDDCRVGGLGGTMVTSSKATLKHPFNISVFFNPESPANLICDDDLEQLGTVTRVTDGDNAWIQVDKEDGAVLRFVKNHERLFVLHVEIHEQVAFLGPKEILLNGGNKATLGKMVKIDRLHRALSYCGRAVLERYVAANLLVNHKIEAKDIDFYYKVNHPGCVACIRGKGVASDEASYCKESTFTCGELVHLDIAYLSMENSQLPPFAMMISIDEYSGFCNFIPVRNKSIEGVKECIRILNAMYKSFKHTIVNIRSDNEPALVDNASAIKREFGITVLNSEPHRHERVAERNIGYVLSLFRATIFGLDYVLPTRWYPDLMRYVVDSTNLCFRDRNPHKTPYEVFTRKQIDVEHVRNVVFGAVVGPRMHHAATDAARRDIGVVLGRDPKNPGSALVYCLASKMLIPRRDNVEVEINSRIREAIHNVDGTKIRRGMLFRFISHRDFVGEVEDTTELRHDDVADTEAEPILTCREGGEGASDFGHATDGTEGASDSGHATDGTEGASDSGHATDGTEGASDSGHATDGENTSTSAYHRRDKEVTWSSFTEDTCSHTDDEVIRGDGNITSACAPTTSTVRTSDRLRGRNKLDWSKVAMMTVRESVQKFGDKDTEKAVLAEIQQMEHKHVWEYLMPTSERSEDTIIPSTMILKDKRDAAGKFVRMKARLAACGNFEDQRDDDNAAPTASFSSLLIVLAIAAKRKMKKATADITGAYLNAELNHKVRMRLNKECTKVILKGKPELSKYVKSDGTIVVLLKKCLYGLRIAARAWYDLLTGFILGIGFVRSEYDPCIWYKIDGSDWSYIVLYVDDMMICCDSDKDMKNIQEAIDKRFVEFTFDSSNECLDFLGLRITTDESGHIHITQEGYITQILKDNGIKRSAKHPMERDLTEDDRLNSKLCADPTTYRRNVMRLMYAAIRTRADINYAVVMLATHMQDPRECDMDALKQVMEYLYGAVSLHVLLLSSGEIKTVCYVDAAFMNNVLRKSHTGFAIFLDTMGSGAIMVKSQVQKTIADSTMESELIALHEAKTVFLLVIKIVDELTGARADGRIIYEDNQSAIASVLDEHAKFRGRSRFIDRKYFSISEVLKTGELKIIYVGTDAQIADFLTKGLKGVKYKKFRYEILGHLTDDSETHGQTGECCRETHEVCPASVLDHV